ncbi:hypothetical protein BD309DRAFT_862479, partial [Dichomitus squalens]
YSIGVEELMDGLRNLVVFGKILYLVCALRRLSDRISNCICSCTWGTPAWSLIQANEHMMMRLIID